MPNKSRQVPLPSGGDEGGSTARVCGDVSVDLQLNSGSRGTDLRLNVSVFQPEDGPAAKGEAPTWTFQKPRPFDELFDSEEGGSSA